MFESLTSLFDTTGFPPRWYCGEWSSLHGWTHVVADAAIFLAYIAIPITLASLVRRRTDVPFPAVFWLFSAFIVCCGFSHLIEASIFWHPWYRLAALFKVLTAIVSWATVLAMIPIVPQVLRFRSPAELEAEVRARTRDLQRTQHALDAAADAIYWTDSEGRITYANESASRQLGYAQDELLAMSFPDLDAQGQPAAWPALRERILQDGVAVTETQQRTKDGRTIPVEVLSQRIQHDHEEFICSFVRDITDRQRQDARFRATVESAPMAIIMVDADGRIVLANQEAHRQFACPRDALLGVSIEELVPEQSRDEHVALRNSYAAAPEARRMGVGRDLYAVRRDGSTFPVEIGLSPVHTDEGLFVLSAIVDITERRQRDAERQEAIANARIAALTQNSDDAIIGMTTTGMINSWNRGATLLYGYTADEAIGMSGERLSSTEHAERLQFKIQQVAEGESVRNRELMHLRKDGTHFLGSLTASPIRDATGAVTGISMVVRDITRRQQIEEALERSNADLERFAYVVSHDLQEPLRAIGGFCQLLQRRYNDKLDDTGRRYIRRSVEGVARMQTLIQDLLTFSRVGRAEREMAAVDLNQCVRTALQGLSEPFEAAGATVDLNDLPVVKGVENMLTQLLQNLLSNAVKFRRPEVAPLITVSSTRRVGGWEIAVADNGIGIDPHYHKQIFTLFQRLHRRDQIPGTGIGLAICKRTVDYHGGTISVESGPGSGSTFRVFLPDEPPSNGATPGQ